MNTMNAIIAIVEASGGKLTSRTALQKLAYFASRCGLINMEFKPHYYGPYSQELSAITNTLVSLNFLSERLMYLGSQPDPWLTAVSGDVKTFQYSLTKESEKIIRRLEKENPKEWKELIELVNICKKKGGGLSPSVLATAAKVDFILSHYTSKLTIDDTVSITKDFGWKLQKNQIKDVISLLKEIKQLRTRINN